MILEFLKSFENMIRVFCMPPVSTISYLVSQFAIAIALYLALGNSAFLILVSFSN